MKRRLINSALPYVNNVPHLGNCIQVLSADAFARFCRLRGYETLYVCGTDEYGTATETRAAEEGISPQALCDRYYAIHAAIYQWFNIAFDKFGRTSTPIQTEVTQAIFNKLNENGYICEHAIDQLYCEHCGRFLADRFVLGTCPACGSTDARGDQCESCGKLLDPTELKEPRCASCTEVPHIKTTKHLYIDLPKLKDRLEAWIKDAAAKGFWAHNAIAMTQAWIRDGLKERAVTRDLKWGIPVPKAGYENKVFYVWFDAPIGYISITGNYAAQQIASDPAFKAKWVTWQNFTDYWWKRPDEVELFQFIGKDNIPFHTVIFPSSLIGSSSLSSKSASDWTMLHHMSSTEYLNYESGKFSKSKGVGVFGTDVMETGIPSDVWRFYIYYNRPEKADALFTWKDFMEKVNGELIGNLGNLVNRTLSFVIRYYEGTIPEAQAGTEAETEQFWNTVREYEDGIAEKLERADLRDAFRQVFELCSFANKTFQDGEPWRARKDAPAKAAALIRSLSFLVRDLAVLIAPYLPAAAVQIASFFGCSALTWADIGKSEGPAQVLSCEVLFSKLEEARINELRERYSGTQAERKEAQGDVEAKAEPAKTPQEIAAAFMGTLDLRAAQIVKIERHPKADKLYIETLQLSEDAAERVIVSGLVPFYTEEELRGKHIIAAYNLKPSKLRGVESKGMLLAASYKDSDGKETVEVLDAGEAPLGTRVLLEGLDAAVFPQPPSVITIDDFFAIPLEVKDYEVLSGGKHLTLAGKPIRTAKIAQGEVH
ncbi:methionine--tRNA ligase [Breznakiellaceae bacterium SP9]